MEIVKIKSIKKLDHVLDRYDLTVSTTNNFYANDILIHNTSFICANVKVKQPKWNGLYEKLFNHLPGFLQFTKVGNDVVYSSRTVIKNKDLNPSVSGGFYSADVWNDYYQILKNHIPQGTTVYGEIIGYVTGSDSMIQKGYDYGCNRGENKLMIYRITAQNTDGETRELNVMDVLAWTKVFIQVLEDEDKKNGTNNASRIHPIDIFYDGELGKLYDIDYRDVLDAIHIPEMPTGDDEAAITAREHIRAVQEARDHFLHYMTKINDLKQDVNTYLMFNPQNKAVLHAWQDVVLEMMKKDTYHFGMEQFEPMCKNKVPREGIVVRIQDDPNSEAFKLKCINFLSAESKLMDRCDVSDSEMMERYS